MPTPDPLNLWRAFPWDETARPGARFSADYTPPQSGQGRFDLPLGSAGGTAYLAETPEHAIAEKIQNLRNRVLPDEFLFEHGHRLALCPVRLHVGARVLVDLCDPTSLRERGVAPDRLAFRDRSVTQGIAETLYADPDVAGFRWWSALFGEWHTVVLFSDRLSQDALAFGEPEPLNLDHPELRAAAASLAIELVR